MRIWLRTKVAPFEAAIAGIIAVQAVIGLAGRGTPNPLDVLLPSWLSYVFSGLYLLAGLAILVGLFWPRGDVESAGLVLLAFLVTARGIMFGALLGWGLNSVIMLAFSAFVAAACVQRVIALREYSLRSQP